MLVVPFVSIVVEKVLEGEREMERGRGEKRREREREQERAKEKERVRIPPNPPLAPCAEARLHMTLHVPFLVPRRE